MPIQAAPPLVTVMGVSGSGKTTVGAALAQRLHVPFADGDDFHPAGNVAKMSAGIPLTDTDRLPWLHALAAWLGEHSATGGVLSCSALRRSYRDVLRGGASTVRFVHLDGSPEVVARRVAGRPGHFMPASLVESQFATLEPLAADEAGFAVDLDRSVDELVTATVTALAGATNGALA
jgi:gluconokinase